MGNRTATKIDQKCIVSDGRDFSRQWLNVLVSLPIRPRYCIKLTGSLIHFHLPTTDTSGQSYEHSTIVNYTTNAPTGKLPIVKCLQCLLRLYSVN